MQQVQQLLQQLQHLQELQQLHLQQLQQLKQLKQLQPLQQLHLDRPPLTSYNGRYILAIFCLWFPSPWAIMGRALMDLPGPL